VSGVIARQQFSVAADTSSGRRAVAIAKLHSTTSQDTKLRVGRRNERGIEVS